MRKRASSIASGRSRHSGSARISGPISAAVRGVSRVSQSTPRRAGRRAATAIARPPAWAIEPVAPAGQTGARPARPTSGGAPIARSASMAQSRPARNSARRRGTAPARSAGRRKTSGPSPSASAASAPILSAPAVSITAASIPAAAIPPASP